MSQSLEHLREIVVRLRAPDGCPWDREQTHDSLRHALIEECYETIDAISRSDDANLREELGDLLLHVVMHAQMAAERKAFDLDEVILTVCEKLVRRHPHVFGEGKAANSNEVLKQWEEIKREEKGNPEESLLAGVPESFPALLHAEKIQKKAARVGFDWDTIEPVIEKIHEEIGEISEAIRKKDASLIHEEVGDLLFSAVNLARKLKVDAELALKDSTKKFRTRFERLENAIKAQNRDIRQMTLSEMDEIWEEAKKTS